MADYSFDVVSKVDLNVIAEAVSAADKEIANRYDFKGTHSSIELNQKENELNLHSSDEYKVGALRDVLFTRLAKRGVALKNFTQGKVEAALGGTAKQSIKIQQGIPADKAKEISSFDVYFSPILQECFSTFYHIQCQRLLKILCQYYIQDLKLRNSLSFCLC